MDEAEARRRFREAPVARLATVRRDGSPHLVPIVFAIEQDTIYSIVDEKPKRTKELQRIANVRHEPRASVLVDHYDGDWPSLWWVRADGRARIVTMGEELDRALDLLCSKYAQYRDAPPAGPAIVIDVDSWRFWSFE